MKLLWLTEGWDGLRGLMVLQDSPNGGHLSMRVSRCVFQLGCLKSRDDSFGLCKMLSSVGRGAKSKSARVLQCVSKLHDGCRETHRIFEAGRRKCLILVLLLPDCCVLVFP
jgi:hypothetical protein